MQPVPAQSSTTEPARIEAGGPLDAMWLHCQQRLIAHVAHDLKGALNGVSVNVEVVRGRAGRPQTPLADVLRYADAACEQLGVVIKVASALLSIGRGVRGSAEVSLVTRQLVSLLEETARSDGATLSLIIEGGMSGATSAPPSAVRLALAEALLPAVMQKRDVSVRMRAGAAPTVEMQSEAGFGVPANVSLALAAVGIRIKTDGHGISIVFPPPTETVTEEA